MVCSDSESNGCGAAKAGSPLVFEGGGGSWVSAGTRQVPGRCTWLGVPLGQAPPQGCVAATTPALIPTLTHQ